MEFITTFLVVIGLIIFVLVVLAAFFAFAIRVDKEIFGDLDNVMPGYKCKDNYKRWVNRTINVSYSISKWVISIFYWLLDRVILPAFTRMFTTDKNDGCNKNETK